MSFPDEQDSILQRQVEKLSDDVDMFDSWISDHSAARIDTVHEITSALPSKISNLKAECADLRVAASVPPAVAVYGVSQSGKSLLLDKLIHKSGDMTGSLGFPGQEASVLFGRDLNPNRGVEATSSVTRFTLADRVSAQERFHDAPVRVRLFKLADVLKALGRGFLFEVQDPLVWNHDTVRALLSEEFDCQGEGHAADAAPLRDAVVDAYRYLNETAFHKRYELPHQDFTNLLYNYPLSRKDYLSLASRLFWSDSKVICEIFDDICALLDDISEESCHIYASWEAVHFILDTVRATEWQSDGFKEPIDWQDVRMTERGGTKLLTYGGGTGKRLSLATLQGIVSEIRVPLTFGGSSEKSTCAELLEDADILDIPGARSAAGRSAVQVRDIKELEDGYRILKRGRVGFLFEKYSSELQIKTLVYLQALGNFDCGDEIIPHIRKWGTSMFGDDNWPGGLPDEETSSPSLFVGLTHLLTLVTKKASKDNVDAQIKPIEQSFTDWFCNYGSPDGQFKNTYFIRYPETLDKNAFTSETVQVKDWRQTLVSSHTASKHFEDIGNSWDAAYNDNDCGVEMMMRGIMGKIDNVDRQKLLKERCDKIQDVLSGTMKSVYIDPASAEEASKRRKTAEKVVAWLADDEFGLRSKSILEELHCDFWVEEVADDQDPMFILSNPDYKKLLRKSLSNWFSSRTWSMSLSDLGGKSRFDGLGAETLELFGRYMVDYLNAVCMEEMAEVISEAASIVPSNRQGSVLHRYATILLDDYLSTPGPRLGREDQPILIDGGCMSHRKLHERWSAVLSERLVSAVEGGNIPVPPGNEELKLLIQQEEGE